MDSLGVDVQILSTNAVFYNYDKDAEAVAAMSRDSNDYVAQLTRDHPTRFAGLANLPMQDVSASIDELERSVTQLGLKGAMIGDHVNCKTFDDPEFLPFGRRRNRWGHDPHTPGRPDDSQPLLGQISSAQQHRKPG